MESLATPLGSGKTCSGCSGTSVKEEGREERREEGREGGGEGGERQCH